MRCMLHIGPMDVTTAVLLVAGSGKRLREAAKGPKCLVDVAGESLLSRSVRNLQTVGVTRIVLATGYREQDIREATVGLADQGLDLDYQFCLNPAFDSTQNSVSLLHCKDAVQGNSFYKLDGDVLYSSEVLLRLRAALIAGNGGGDGVQGVGNTVVVALDEAAQLADEEMKVRERGAFIEVFGKGLTPGECAGETLGIEAIPSGATGPLFAGLDAVVTRGDRDLYYEDVYNDLLANGIRFASVRVGDLRWTEVDTPSDLERARHIARAFQGVGLH